MGQKSIIFLTILVITAVALAVIFVITLLVSDNRGESEIDDESEASSTLLPKKRQPEDHTVTKPRLELDQSKNRVH